MASDHLFRLIKSLSKNEKVYIRRNATFHTFKGKKNKYIKLFDALEQMDVYEEKALLKYFEKDDFLNTLPTARNYLFNVLLRNLEAYHHNIRSEIRSCLNQAEILLEKGLMDQCGKIIAKAESVAITYELHDELLNLETFKLNLNGPGQRNKKYEETLLSMQDSMNNILKDLQLSSDDQIELKMIAGRCGFLGQARSSAEVLELENWVSIIEKKKNAVSRSFTAAFTHYHKLTMLFHALNKPMKELVYSKKKIELFSKNLQMIEVAPYLYLFPEELERSFTLQLSLGYYDELQEGFETLYKQCTQNRSYKKLMQLSLHHLMFRTCSQIGRFEAALKQSEAIINLFDELDLSETLETRKKRFTLELAIVHLILKNHKSSLRCLDEILGGSASEFNSDLYYFAQILQLLVYFEKGDIELLLYRTRSAYRTLYRNNKLFRIEKLLLDFLRKENEAGWDKKEEKEIFTRLKKNLLNLFKANPEEKKLLNYFDLPAWIDSKIEKRTMAEILEDRYRRLYQSASGKQLIKYIEEE